MSEVPDGQDHSCLRVWTVRIEAAVNTICIGIANPSTAPDYHPDKDRHTISVLNNASAAYKGPDHNGDDIQFPHTARAENERSVGSLYHFTANLWTASVRVRPVIPHIASQYKRVKPPKTEWTIGQGIDDLAEYRAAVGLIGELDSCTLVAS
jgi:hypothetical protein